MASKTEYLQIRVTADEKAELKKVAERAGLDLSTYVRTRALPAHAGRLDEILQMLAGEESEGRRYVLAELNDLLTELAPIDFSDTVLNADVSELSAFLQSYVAAMVEQAAGQKGVFPPPWTSSIGALDRPYFAVPFTSLRGHLLREAPIPFKRRNIFVDSGVGARI